MRRHSIDISETDGVRYLHFGNDAIQGAMRIARPWALELEYTRDMLAGLILRSEPGWPRTCLMIGLGAAAQLRFLHRYFPACRITVLEINPDVIATCAQFFKLPAAAANLEIITADASIWIGSAPADHYDLILLDAFSAQGLPRSLDTSAFYGACRACLSAQGLLASNLLSHSAGFAARARRIDHAFAGRTLRLPPCESGNTILLAAHGARIGVSLATLHERAAQLWQRTGLDLRPLLARLRLAHSLPEDRHLQL